MTTSSTNEFPIIGIGASAGGLESIKAFFKHVPQDSGYAFVIIQHLSPDFKSFMPEILSRETNMKICTTQDQVVIKPNTIYLMIPKKNIFLSNGKLHLETIDRTRIPNKQIDLFFHSLAEEKGKDSIGIILSGTGSDGTLGIKTIHEKGGTVLVESMASAKFDGMPGSAITTQIVDHVGTPMELCQYILGEKTIKIGTQKTMLPTPSETNLSIPKNITISTDRYKILHMVQERYGVDFSKYKINPINRRIDKQIQLLNLGSVPKYLEYMQENPSEVSTLYYGMLIGVTHFFRDEEAFQKLEVSVIPKLFGEVKPEKEFRVWVSGCSSGEEVYSLAIFLHEASRVEQKGRQFKIFATDVDDEILSVATEGVYQKESLRAVRDSLLTQYFLPEKEKEAFRISPEIRRYVIFARHNLLDDPPFKKMDLISCRNLLIYFGEDAQKIAMSTFYFGLNDGGVLFLGPSESLGKFEQGYKTLDRKWKIYQKSGRLRVPYEIQRIHRDRKRQFSYLSANNPVIKEKKETKSIDIAFEALLQQFVPPSLLITEQLDILHTFGNAGRYMHPQPGAVSLNLRHMANERIVTAVTVSLQRAKREGQIVEYQDAQLSSESTSETVDVILRPLFDQSSQEQPVFLVSFRERVRKKNKKSEKITLDEESLNRVGLLEIELQNTKENLQATIEELETTNEELQSTNEELLASNEELQSTNEELHSLNEELYTVNSEHQSKIEQLTQLTRDEENLLKATDIGIIFLDKELKIRKFTPAVAGAFHLLSQDLGRPLEHITHTIEVENLVEQIQEVLKTQKSFEHDVRSKNGTPYLLRILPYLTKFNQIEGVVLSFVDVSKIKETEKQLAKQNRELQVQGHYLSKLQDVINDGYWDWHIKDDYEYMSPTFWKMFGYKPEEKDHHPSAWQDMINPDDLKVALDNFQKHVETKGKYPYHQEVRYRHKNGSTVWVHCRGKVVEWDQDGKPLRMIGSHSNITALKSALERHELVEKGAAVGIWDWIDVNKKKEQWSSKFYELLGYQNQEIEASLDNFQKFLHPEDQERTFALVEKHLQKQVPFDLEYRLRTKNGEYRWFHASGYASWDKDGTPKRMVGSIQDIHEKKIFEQKLERSNSDLRQFAYVASHDLKTPLRHVSSFAQLLSDKISKQNDKESQKYIERITSSCDRMRNLLEGLLRVSQLENNELKIQPVNLEKIVRVLHRELKDSIETNGALLKINPLPTLNADPILITQLFQNLLENALKFKKEDRKLTIEIDAKKFPEKVKFWIKDNGIGMKKEHLTKIFHIFQRLNSSETYPGSGIGLALCKKVVERHKGNIWVESVFGEGTTFVVELPETPESKK